MKVDEGLGELFGDIAGEDKWQVARNIIDYLIANEKEATTKALQEAKLIPKAMNEFEIYATMEHSRILPYHWKKIVQCLKCFHEVDGLWASEAKINALGSDHNEVHVGVYDHDEDGTGKVKERIRYWWRDPVDELLSVALYLIQTNDIDPVKIERIKSCHGGDHASSGSKPKHRFLAKCTIEMKKEEGKDEPPKSYSQVYTLADVHCKKDSEEVLKNTIMEPMCNGMDRIAEGTLIVVNDGSADKPKYRVELAEKEDENRGKNIPTTCFLTGDLKFLAVMLGKAEMERWWCCYCDMFKPDWQPKKPEVAAGQLWTVESLTERAKTNTDKKLTGAARGGVTRRPHFTKGVHIVFPALHALIGLGNDLLKYFFDKIDSEIEPISREEMELRDSIGRNKILLERAKQDYQVWIGAEDGGLKVIELTNIQKELKEQMEQVEKTTPLYNEMKSVKKDVDDRLKALGGVSEKYKKEIDRLKKAITDAPGKLAAFQTGRKLSAASLYSRCEEVLKEKGIDRGLYHGGAFNGVNIIKIMQQNSLMDKLEEILTENGRLTAEKVKTLCTDVKTALRAWDSIFSCIHQSNPTQEFCDKLQVDIDAAMAQWRGLKLSVTPKLHGLECHVVAQMILFGGIKDLLEYWVEQEHQIGNRKDVDWMSQSAAAQGRLRAKHDVAARKTETIEATKAVKAKFVGIRKRLEKTETVAKNKIKREGRDEALGLLREKLLAGKTMSDFNAIVNDM